MTASTIENLRKVSSEVRNAMRVERHLQNLHWPAILRALGKMDEDLRVLAEEVPAVERKAALNTGGRACTNSQAVTFKEREAVARNASASTESFASANPAVYTSTNAPTNAPPKVEPHPRRVTSALAQFRASISSEANASGGNTTTSATATITRRAAATTTPTTSSTSNSSSSLAPSKTGALVGKISPLKRKRVEEERLPLVPSFALQVQGEVRLAMGNIKRRKRNEELAAKRRGTLAREGEVRLPTPVRPLPNSPRPELVAAAIEATKPSGGREGKVEEKVDWRGRVFCQSPSPSPTGR